MPGKLGLKPYEVGSLVLAVVFGLAGALLHETLGEFGEYIALFICLPPPAVYYLVGMTKNKKPSS